MYNTIAILFFSAFVLLNALLLYLAAITRNHANDLQKRVEEKPSKNIREVNEIINKALADDDDYSYYKTTKERNPDDD